MIAVTGAEGFIGKNLVEKLKEEVKEKIIEVDFKHSSMNPYKFLEFLEDSDEVSTIFHNGACSNTRETDVDFLYKRNLDYSIKLLKICLRKNIRLVYASSASVYGDGSFNEENCKKPKNYYAITKSIFHDYVTPYLHNNIVGLRYFNDYGKYEEHKGDMASVIYKFKNQLPTGKIKLFKNSDKFYRDFVHVDDVVNINLFFYKNPEICGIFNLGTGVERSFQDIGDIFEKRYSCKIEYIDFPENLEKCYQKFTKADNSKLLSVYKYKFFSLEEGVEKYLNYLEGK